MTKKELVLIFFMILGTLLITYWAYTLQIRHTPPTIIKYANETEAKPQSPKHPTTQQQIPETNITPPSTAQQKKIVSTVHAPEKVRTCKQIYLLGEASNKEKSIAKYLIHESNNQTTEVSDTYFTATGAIIEKLDSCTHKIHYPNKTYVTRCKKWNITRSNGK